MPLLSGADPASNVGEGKLYIYSAEANFYIFSQQITKIYIAYLSIIK